MTERGDGQSPGYSDVQRRAANLYVADIISLHFEIAGKPDRELLRGENVPAVRTILRHPTSQGIRDYAARLAVPLGIEEHFRLDRRTSEFMLPALDFYPAKVPHADLYFGQWTDTLTQYQAGLNQLKLRTVGTEQGTGAANYISACAIDRAAWLAGIEGYDYLKHDPDIPRRIEVMGEATMHVEDKTISRVGVRIFEFASSLRNVSGVLQHLESLPGPLTADEQRQRLLDARPEDILTPEEQTAALKEANDTLYERTRELQEYGVKSVVAPSLIPEGGSLVREWLIDDPISQETKMAELIGDARDKHSLQYLPKRAATFFGTASRFVSSNVPYGTGDRATPYQTVPFAGAEIGAVTQDPQLPSPAVVLGMDGQLKTMQGYDIREFIEHAGMGSFELELMRAEILNIFSDLVTPVWVAKIAEQEAKMAKPAPTRELQREKTEESEPTMREIVLARAKVIEIFHDEIIADLKREVEENTVTESVQDPDKPKKMMEKHTVVGHRRRIAPNHRASPQARSLALEAGIVLPEFGLTWEKEHERGDLPPKSLGHRRAKQERPSAAREAAGETILFKNIT